MTDKLIPHPDKLMPGEALQPGLQPCHRQSITSLNKKFKLIYQEDGNLCVYIYPEIPEYNCCIWATNTNGTVPGKAVLQNDGNFVVYDGNNIPVRATGTKGKIPSYLQMESDGNLVLYGTDGNCVVILWSIRNQMESDQNLKA